MADTLGSKGVAAGDAAIGAIAIDYSGADQEFTRAVRGIYVGTAGNLKVDMADGTSGVTFSNLAAGSIYALKVTKIYQTGSTAAGLALY